MTDLRADAECLMKCPAFIVKVMGWSWKIPIQNWKGIKIKNGRITRLDLSVGCNWRTWGKSVNTVPIGAEGAAGLVLPPGLKELDLWGNKIGAEGAKRLVLPPGLQKLDLFGNNIGAEGVKGLVLPPGLQELDLFGNNIGAEGVKGLVLPPGLQELYLRFNKIGDEGVKGLVLPPGLQMLNLRNNNIGDEGAKGLVLPPGLQSLNLKDNNIGDEGAKGLVLPPGLQSLNLKDNNIGLFGTGLFAPSSDKLMKRAKKDKYKAKWKAKHTRSRKGYDSKGHEQYYRAHCAYSSPKIQNTTSVPPLPPHRSILKARLPISHYQSKLLQMEQQSRAVQTRIKQIQSFRVEKLIPGLVKSKDKDGLQRLLSSGTLNDFTDLMETGIWCCEHNYTEHFATLLEEGEASLTSLRANTIVEIRALLPSLSFKQAKVFVKALQQKPLSPASREEGISPFDLNLGIYGIMGAEILPTLRRNLGGITLYEKPSKEYNNACVKGICDKAIAFAKNKITEDGGIPTLDKNGLNKTEIGAINLYTQEAIYRRLNGLLNTKKERAKRIRPWFPYMRILFTSLQQLRPHRTGNIYLFIVSLYLNNNF